MKVKFFTFLAFPLLAVLPMKAFVSSDVYRVEEKKDVDLEGDKEEKPYCLFNYDNKAIDKFIINHVEKMTMRGHVNK